MKVVVAAFHKEKALVGAFSVITNLRMELFEALLQAALRALLDLGVLMWAALTCYALFSRQEIADGFFARDILAQVSNHLQICVISTYLYHIYTIYISTSLPRSSPRSASRAWASWAAAPSSCCPWSPWRVNSKYFLESRYLYFKPIPRPPQCSW